MELKITPEDLVPDFNRKQSEAIAHIVAHASGGNADAAKGWLAVLDAMVGIRLSCERLNEKLATLTTQTVVMNLSAGFVSSIPRVPCPTCRGDDPSDGPQAHQCCGTCMGAGTVPAAQEGGR